MHFHDVDDPFVIFDSVAAFRDFLAHLNALQYTFEMEQLNVLPFIDELVEKSTHGFPTTICLPSRVKSDTDIRTIFEYQGEAGARAKMGLK